MFKKIELWIVLLIVVFFFITHILYGALLRHEYNGGKKFPLLQNIAVFLSSIPANSINFFKKSIRNELYIYINRNEFSKKSNKNKTPSSSSGTNFFFHKNGFNQGYILTSIHDKNYNSSKTILFDIKNEKILKEWYIDKSKIQIYLKNFIINSNTFASQHPYLNKDGSIIFSESAGPMVSLDVCNKINWVIDRHTHHSINKVDENKLIINTIDPSKDFYKNYEEFDMQRLSKMKIQNAK